MYRGIHMYGVQMYRAYRHMRGCTGGIQMYGAYKGVQMYGRCTEVWRDYRCMGCTNVGSFRHPQNIQTVRHTTHMHDNYILVLYFLHSSSLIHILLTYQLA